MSASTDTTSTAFWSTGAGEILAIALLVVVAGTVLFGNLSGIGIWEPWEANEIFTSQEYSTRGEAPELESPTATSWNWAVPTHKRRPVDRPLLSTVVVAQSIGDGAVTSSKVGTMEWRARLPGAVVAFLLVLLGAGWVYRRFGVYRAAICGSVFATIPAIYLGVHNLAAEVFFVATSTLAVLAFFELVAARGRARWGWSAALAFTLVLTVFEMRLLGLYLVLFVAACFCAAEAALEEAIRRRDGPSAPAKIGGLEWFGSVAVLVIGAAVIHEIWSAGKPAGADAEVAGWAVQLVGMVAPIFVIVATAWLGRRSRPGRAFWSPQGLVGTAVGAGAAVYLAWAYSLANPILLDNGELFGDVRVFGFMLENHIFERSVVDQHMTFDVVMRQAGFSLFPWVALLPAGFAYVGAASTTTSSSGAAFDPRAAAKRLCMVWPVAAAVAIGAASGFDHYFYPAYFPIAVAIGLLITDREFVRRTPMAAYAAGFVAIVVILMLGKDLERYPTRFIELYLNLQEDFELPDDFSWGRLYKPMKYVWMVFFGIYFFGVLSWAVVTVGNLRRLPARLKARDWKAIFAADGAQNPMESRAAEKVALRQGDGVVARILRFVETPLGFAPTAVVLFWLSALAFVHIFVPEVTNHLSQRGVFETYTRLADGDEPLYRYQVTARDNSIYLQDLEDLKSSRQLHDAFGGEERIFAVIPRSKLAAINYDVRKAKGKNLAVLDARSSRLLLVSNRLEDGETDHNFVADKIVEGEPQVDYPVTYESGGEQKHAVFDGALEFLGYSLDKPRPSNGVPVYEWGEEMVITYYFRVLKRVPSSQKIFLHVDYPGNRINGDHYPNDGEFPTNYWLPGDVVKDVHPLEIDSYSSPGVYTLNMGFFLGSRRMSVTPREAHDGRDRITIGKIEVKSGI